ncbi:hypothetical protein [Dyadobacter sp. 676]|uniref:Glycosyltransferase n=1 Tax=Dyadobacter sp. 676 TaxID=3088362 RepID=A0AAU8FK29_9BACT
MQYNPAPILLFVYKRPAHTKRTLEALAADMLADESVLYIYADGPRADASDDDRRLVTEVRRLIRDRKWCKEVHIIESAQNKGLANSIIEGVTRQVNEHGRVIVLEDDLIVARGFLKYMNEALERYEKQDKVMQVCGYQFPIGVPATRSAFFLPLTASWGWATWKRAWSQFDPRAEGYEELKTNPDLARRFDLNGTIKYKDMLIDQMERKNISSWAIRWWWTVFKADGISLFPDNSLVNNVGFGKDATHTKGPNPFGRSKFDPEYTIFNFPETIGANEEYFLRLQEMYRRIYPANERFVDKVIRKLRYGIDSIFRREEV